MALLERRINAIFVLGEGDFGTAGENQVELSGLRISAKVTNAGGRAMGTADVRIWGMTLSKMNQLSTLGMIATQQRKNSITLTAGAKGDTTMATFFQGTIFNAWGDFQAQPDVPFHVLAQATLFNAVQPAQPISIRGSADVAIMLSGIASQMGLAFENNGVNVKLSNSYYAGSARDQALAIVKAAGIEWNGGENGTLAIWIPGQSRGGAVAVISAETSLIGYPAFTANGISLRTRFNPQIGLGSKIEVRSQLGEPLGRALAQPGSATPPASRDGFWVVYKIDHDLDAQLPRGQWQSTILAAPPGLGPFVA